MGKQGRNREIIQCASNIHSCVLYSKFQIAGAKAYINETKRVFYPNNCRTIHVITSFQLSEYKTHMGCSPVLRLPEARRLFWHSLNFQSKNSIAY